MIGIGGGELYGPYFLTLHVLPQVSSATTSLMSLVSYVNNIVHHLLLRDFDQSAGAVLFFVGMAGGAAGRTGALRITRLFQRPSLLIFTLALILLLSGAVLVGELTYREVQFHVSPLCT